MKKPQVLAALSALAHETRLDLLRLLMAAGPEGLAQGEIARRLGVSASGLAFHLGLLVQAGLICTRRAARHVFYTADTAGIGAVLGYVLRDCCQSHPEISACCQRDTGGTSG
jgi:DNA-binding transcriptional ArsR family regulator